MPRATLLREVRKRRGMPLAELARRAQVSRNTLYSAEAGEPVGLASIVKIAAALEVRLADISPEAAEAVAAVASLAAEVA